MQEKLQLLHQFMNEVSQTENEDELTGLLESYADKLDVKSEEDELYQLFQDAQMLGREILFLKSSVTDIARNKKIATLTEEERSELVEAEIIIDENRFSYHFQPIVNTLDGSIYSYEALMRPKSDMGMTPLLILKYAELMGRLKDIESETFLNVLSIIDSNKAIFKDRRVFINSIPKIKLKGSEFRRVGELLIKHSDTAVVELTEQTESADDDLETLKERYLNMGVKIAIDDYGTGYSNVNNLLRYMPDYVKIDRSLISDIQNNPQKKHFVREIIDFCHATGIMALAEGVETSEELRTVILMGVDLIQGFYTARPDAEIADSIPYEITQEIKLYQQERQDGRDQQVYAVEAGERVQLSKLVKDDYQCILVGSNETEDSEITIAGSPTLDTEVHIEVAQGFKGKIILENVHLSNIKNRPCINLNEDSDVTLLLKGENKLNKGGIQVPEGARLTLEGDGILDINIDAEEYFCIGNDTSSTHGDLTLNQTGILHINVSGKIGICIGSGQGGNITIGGPGKYILKARGNTAVGMGALYADTKLDVTCGSFDFDFSVMRGVAIGSLTGSADIQIGRSATKFIMSGEEIVGVGTINGDSAVVSAKEVLLRMDIRAARCTCLGSLDGSNDLKLANISFQVELGGKQSLPFGGLNRDTKVSLLHTDAAVNMETDVDIETYFSSDNIQITGGRSIFSNYGNEIDLGINE